MKNGTVNNNIEAIYELAPMQEGMFFHYLLDQTTTEYILQAQMEIRNPFSEELSRKALSLLIMRYEVLRTSFTSKTKLPLQVVRRTVEPEYLIEDYGGQVSNSEILNELMRADLSRGFRLDEGLPIRITHVIFDDTVVLIWTIHHIVIDGWCISVLMQEFLKYYKLLELGRSYEEVCRLVQRDRLEDLPYKEYVQWQKRQKSTACEQYWEQLLSDYEAKQVVPMLCPSETPTSGVCETFIQGDAYEDIKCLAIESQVTISTVIESAYGILLQLRTGGHDIVIGKVVSGRDAPLPHIGTAVGLYVNTIASRICCRPNQLVSELLADVQQQSTNALPYSQISLMNVQKKYMGGGKIAGLYAFENYYVNPETVKRMQENGIAIISSREQTNYPLTLRAFDKNGIELTLMYDEKVFGKEECELLLKQLKQILLQMCDKGAVVEQINGVSEKDTQQIVYDFNNTTTSYPRNSCVFWELEQQIALHREKTAIVYKDEQISYGELEELSAVLAEKLKAAGVERGTYVALLAKRTPQLILALVAIMRAGGVYVPIDTAYPQSRVRMILDECEPKVVLIDSEYEVDSSWPTVIRLDDPDLFVGNTTSVAEYVDATEPAYVIYTSGTTGRPKGTIVAQRAILRLVKNIQYAKLDENSRLLQMGAVAFDASTFEIWGMLLNGGTLYLASESMVMDTAVFKETVSDYNINVMWMTAALFNFHVANDPSAFDGVEQLLVGGEKLSEYHVRMFQAHNKDTVLINGYGPTENTTFTTTYCIPKEFQRIPIGKPISNTGVVIARQGVICGIGMPGELLCWGDGLSSGYLNNQALTERCFVKLDAFDQVMYKTGDLARWLPDGTIEYLGRIDQQIKIRGFRVEVEEIEKRICAIDSVKDCAVVAQLIKGENILCAYVVGDVELDFSEIRKTLRTEIPEYMIPTFWGRIDEIPLTVNGKVDRLNLPNIIERNDSKKMPPEGETEELVAKIFGQILGLDKVYREEEFFELGGHSLRAMALVNAIESNTGIRLSLRDIFEEPTVMGLASKLTIKAQAITIQKAPDMERYPMSPSQQRMYILSKREAASVAYNMPCCIMIPGVINADRMNAALKSLVAIHESLRTVFFEDGGAFYQQIREDMQLDLVFECSDSEINIHKYLVDFVKPFNLEEGPLVRIKFVQCQDYSYAFFDMHHIISDGMSMNIFARDLLLAYEGKQLQPHVLHYRDYSEWMRTRDLSKQEEYWLTELGQDVSVLNMPYDHARPAVQSFVGGIVKQRTPQSLRKKVLDLSKQTGTTEFMVLASVLMILLSRYSNQENVTIGTVVSGRVTRETEDMLGVFVNTLVLKENIQEGERYLSFLAAIKNKCLSALDNQEYPFDLLCQKLNLPRDPSRNALFDVMFSLQNNEKNVLPGQAQLIMSDDEVAAKFDLSVDVHPDEDGYQIDYTFCKAIYDKETVERFAEHYMNLLESVVDNKVAYISELAETDAAEQEKLLFAFNPESNPLPEELNVVTQFWKTASRYPDRQAVCYKNECCTYGELAARIQKTVGGLRGNGVEPGNRIALVLSRGVDMIVGIYAVLSAGAAYIPIEPSYPADRKNYIIGDANPSLILCDCGETEALVECGITCVTIQDLECTDGDKEIGIINPKDVAYLIYTSGTTGKPKGAILRHDSLMNLCVELNRYAYEKYETPVNGALLASYCFDASIQQLFVPLIYGHTLHIICDDIKINAESIFKYYVQHQIRVSDGTPSHLKMLLERPMPTIYADTFLIGGEVLSPYVAKEFIERYGVTLFNVYGPTEATVDATLYECTLENMDRKCLPIGKPLNNVSAYVLRGDQFCGIDIPGELCIGGIGVGDGYQNLPEETAKKFVPNPVDGSVMYRTGDIARWRSDGNLEYIGRIDQQVKIHGFRIETQEIEKAIGELEVVQDCAVVAKEIFGELTLCAYLVLVEDEYAQLGYVVSCLKKGLPTYMIPKYWACCKSLPRNNSGKLDYSRLDGELMLAEQENYVAPQTELEKLVADAFAEVVNSKRVGRNDDFFSLGGHSLNAGRVINLIEEKAKVRLKLQDIFLNPVVSELATVVAVGKVIENPILPCDKAAVYAVSPAQLRIYMMQMLDDGGTAYNMPMCLRMKGRIDHQKVKNCLFSLTKQHETLRTSFFFEDGVLSQHINKDSLIDFTVVEVDRLQAAADYMAEFIRPFDLSVAPLMRTKLVIAPDSAYLLVDIHHIISDARSVNIIIEEFATLYSGGVLPEQPVHYKDYAVWLQKQDHAGQEKFWNTQFAEELSVLDLPTDFSRPQRQDFSGDLVRIKLKDSLIEKLKDFIKGSVITEYAVFLSVLMITLSKYGRSEDVIVGTSVSGRTHRDTERMLGMFVNTVALRGNPSKEKRFDVFLREIAELTVQSFDNQDYPFENIVNEFGVAGEQSRNPIFDVMLTLQNNEQTKLELDGVEIQVEETGKTIAKFDLDIDIVPSTEGYEVLCAYATCLFKRSTAEGIVNRFVFFLEYLLENPESRIGDLPLATPEEYALIGKQFHQELPKDDFCPCSTVIAAFEAQVEATPDRIALEMGTFQYTYRELNTRANRLAHKLRELGIQPDEPVVIISKRSMDVIVAIYGIQKAGGAYFPVDPTYGKERIDFIVQDCAARIVLVDEEHSFVSDMLHVEQLDNFYSGYAEDNLPHTASAKNLMYLTSTSGSTGLPKSVMIENGAVLAYVKAFSREFDICQEDVVLQQSALNFDTVVEELYPAHLCGGRVVLLPQDRIIDVNQAYRYIIEKQVTVVSCSTLLLNEFNALQKPSSVRLYLNGGDVLKYEYIDYLQSYSEVGNTFGPTECTVCAALYHVPKGTGKISVGHPIPGAKLYVVNGNNQLCGIGVPGELWIGGIGVGRGYLNRNELNKEKFVENPFEDGRIFRTGDAVRWLPDGNLEYLGRIDQQVKIRGFRVELGEIESAMRKNSNIHECTVISKKRNNGDRYLCAYYVTCSGEDLDESVLKDDLAKFLPNYMVPQHMMRMNELPLTGSGKVDKRALPEIHMKSSCSYEAPETEEERLVAEAFQSVLEVEKVGRDDNFFELGGHSLRALRVLNAIEASGGVRIALKEVFAHPTVKELARVVAEATDRMEEIEPVEKKSAYEMSSMQRRLYMINQIDETGTSYNMPACFELVDGVELDKLQAALNSALVRHEALRTRFDLVDGVPMQIVEEQVECTIQTCVDTEHRAVESHLAEFMRPFDLSKAPLIRVKVVKAEDKNYLLIDMHHIIMDGMSINILLSDITRLYHGEELTPLKVHYKDYSEWMHTRDLSAQQAYWKSCYEESVELLDMPTDYKRPQKQSFAGANIRITISTEVSEQIAQLASVSGVTEYMVLLSAVGMLLEKYSRQEDIVVGSAVANRPTRATEQMLGMFVNTLALRLKVSKQERYSEYLGQLKKVCLGAFENQEYPFEELVTEIDCARDLSRNPLFDVMFTFQNNEDAEIDSGIAKIVETEVSSGAKFDLSITIAKQKMQYVCDFSYRTDLYDKETISAMANVFALLLKEIAEDQTKTLEDYSCVQDIEQVKRFGVKRSTCTCATLAELFEQQVEAHPQDEAVVFGTVRLTYTQLNEHANVLAHKLIAAGVDVEDRVALLGDRSEKMIEMMLGVTKAGAAYVPIDPTYPSERKRYILEDVAPKLILTTDKQHVPEGMQAEVLEYPLVDITEAEERENPELRAGVDNAAYIIYTSGTTGNPKGVVVEHRGIGNLRDYFVKEQGCGNGKRSLQFASFSFDATISEICMSLLCGGCMCIAEDAVRGDSSAMEQFLMDEKITHGIFPPAFFQELDIHNTYLKHIITAGSESNEEITKKALGKCSYSNDYGPTEATVCATHGRIKEPIAAGKRVTIGKPLENVEVYVLQGKALCGIGMPGELCIGGIGVARGYLNRPELTAEKFVPNPYGEGRLYRTGDLARWLPDGNLEYLGRIDQQVKIRGFRVELGEIEAVLRQYPGITDSTVIVRNGSRQEQTICAYYVTQEDVVEESLLREYLAKKLPGYMLPGAMMRIDHIPLNHSGKVDKRALPEIHMKSSRSYEAPETEEERLVAEAFQSVLEVEKVGRDDNFFELGGHSLRALRVLNAIEASGGVRIALKEVFAHPTVKELARVVAEATDRMEEIEPVEKKSAYEMSSMQRRLYMINQIDETGTSYNMPACFELVDGVELDKLQAALNSALVRHEALRTRFDLVDGVPMQIVEEQVECTIQTCVDTEHRAVESHLAEFMRPFDLSKAPLIRVKVVKAEDKNYLLIDMHHIIMDGMSINILLSDITRLYHGEELTPLKVHYKDYSEWMHTRDLSAQQAYWKSCYEESVELLDMPTDYKRPQKQSFAGANIRITISTEVSEQIAQLASVSGVTEYMVLLSAVGMLLEKYSRQEDIVVGSAVANRPTRATEQMLGMFVNTLALRLKVSKQERYSEYLGQLKKVCLGAFENQEYPFEELVTEIDCARDLSRNPLFDVMFTFQNNEDAEIDSGIAKIVETEVSSGAKFDLSITIAKQKMQYVCDFSYRTDLYDKETISAMANVFALLLKEIAEDQTKTLEDYSCVQDIEQVKRFGVKRSTCTCATLAELFEQQVEAHPQDEAVVFGTVRLTYTQLNEHANVLAHKLIAAGVDVEDRVALLGDRSEKMIEMMLGVTKAGAAYVPIDPTYPSERKRYILEDVAPKLILTTDKQHVPEGMQAEVLEYPLVDITEAEERENPELRAGVDNAAYIIYTSGTTGNPKGVVVEHRGIGNLRDYFVKEQGCGNGKRSLQFASFSFDATISEICMSLLCGGCMCIAEDAVRGDSSAMEQFLMDEKITHGIFPPAFFQELDIHNTYLKHIITAGSESNEEITKKALGKCSYSNDYGPTEATVCATHGRIKEPIAAGKRVTIGKPLENVEVYVLQGKALCGIGMPGELCIGGIGVARGYLNRPELTAEKFVPNPYGEGRLYRTGDLARWLPDGNLEYLGRIDQQVKIRGFRVELGEIEAVLRQYPGITDSTVIVRNGSRQEQTICAYYVTQEDVVEESLLREYLAKKLPGYMLPGAMMRIDHIPLNHSGKVDKRALPEIHMKSSRSYEAPETEEERLVAEAFQSVLGVEKVGRDDNFFELGGDSIKIMRVKSLIQQSGYDFLIADFMRSLDVAHCAQTLRRMDVSRKHRSTGAVKPTPMLKKFLEWNFQQPEYFGQSVLIQMQHPDEAVIRKTLGYITQYHDVLRMVSREGTFFIPDVGENENYEMYVYQAGTWSPETLTKTCQKIKGSFDLANGPLLKVALFMGEYDAQLFIVVHHLAVDAVSWGILLEDFKNVYFAYCARQEIQLPPKTLSYVEWAELLQEYSVSDELDSALSYWETVEKQMPTKDIHEVTASRRVRSLVVKKSEFPELDAVTRGGAMDNVLGCGYREIIAAAVAYGRGQERIGMMVEGRGRNEILGQTPDRTVGWFTSESPIVVNCENNVLRTLISISRDFAQLEHKGNSYSVLRYISQKISGCNPEIGYNFFSESFSAPQSADEIFGESSYSSGRDVSEQNAFGYPISVLALEKAQELRIEFEFSNGYEEEEIDCCLQRCRKALSELNELCSVMVHSGSAIFEGKVWKVKDLKKWIVDSYAAFEKQMIGVSPETLYDPTFLQKICLDTKDNAICAHSVWLPAEKTDAVLTAIHKVLREQSALRTGYSKAAKKMVEYAEDAPIGVWCIDISDNTNQTVEFIFSMTERVFGVNQAFRDSPLLSKIVVYKTLYGCMVYVFAHHAVSDLRSALVFEHRIRFYLQHTDQAVAQFPKYSEMCQANSRKDMDMEQLLVAAKSYAQHLRKLSSTYAYKFKYREDQLPQNLPVTETGIRIMKNLVKQNGYSGQFPLIVVHHGRNQDNASMYGMFLRAVGILLDTETSTVDEHLLQNVLSDGIWEMPNLSINNRIQFMRHWKKIPVLNASVSYGVNFGLTKDSMMDDALANEAVIVKPSSVMIQSGSDGITLILGGCTEERAAVETWLFKELNKEPVSQM